MEQEQARPSRAQVLSTPEPPQAEERVDTVTAAQTNVAEPFNTLGHDGESDGSSTPTTFRSISNSPVRATSVSRSPTSARSLRRTRDVNSLRAISLSMAPETTPQTGQERHESNATEEIITGVEGIGVLDTDGEGEGEGDEQSGERPSGIEHRIDNAIQTSAATDDNASAPAPVPTPPRQLDPNTQFDVEEDADLPGYGAAVYGGDNRDLIDGLPQEDENVRTMQIALRHTESALQSTDQLDNGHLTAEERFELSGRVRDSLRLVQEHSINAFRGVYDEVEAERNRHRQTEQAHAAERGRLQLVQQQLGQVELQYTEMRQRAQRMENAYFHSNEVAEDLRRRNQALQRDNRDYRQGLLSAAQGIINIQHQGDVLRNEALAALRIYMPRVPSAPAIAPPIDAHPGVLLHVAQTGADQQPVRNDAEGSNNNVADEYVAAAARAGIPVEAWRLILTLAEGAAAEDMPN